MDSEELQTILSEQSIELAMAKALDSDLDFAFQLQMQEALTASVSQHTPPSTPPTFHFPDDDVVSDPSFASLIAEEIARFEQERSDREQAEAEMRQMRENLDRRIHDQAFALDISRITEEEWANTGDYFNRPYGEGSSSASSSSPSGYMTEAFKLYFKGLVREERTAAGFGIAICDLGDNPIFESRKPLVGGEMSLQVVEVKALIEGLNVALSLGIKRIAIFCDSNSLYQYVTGKAIPVEGNLTTLVSQLTLLRRKFSYCNPSLVAQHDIKFALELAREAIVSQVTWPAESSHGKYLKETCSICFEVTDVSQMFSVDVCLHRYCPSCMKTHVEVKLLQGMLPKCPHDGCKTELKFESCKKILTPELCEIMDQRIKESSIPATQKIYCPYPRCSALMSKAEALGRTNHVGPSKCNSCHGLFCVNCKVPWHNNMSCYNYKNLNPFPCAEDAKLKSLATRNRWRQCLKCSNMVELAEGCNHIYCRCGYEFCYICGAEWKNKKATCACPLWDERYIVRS